MALTRVQCSIQGGSALPTDRYVNTFYVQSPSAPSTAEHQNIADIFGRFYTDPQTEGTTQWSSIESWMHMGATASGEDLVIKTYDMAEPETRVPKITAGYELAGANPGLPAEVALCLSFRAAPQSGVAIGRRRGRVFIGPLSTQCVEQVSMTGWSAARPNVGVTVSLVHSARRMANELIALGMEWVVHSPTTGPLAAFEVAEVSCDNAFDTVRSRGLAATTRTALSVPV